MRHKYLPRVGAGVLALGGLTAGAVAGCSDPTAARTGGTSGGARLIVAVTRPAGDTLPQMGVEFTARLRDSIPMRALVLYVDSGTAAQQKYAYTFGVYNNVPLPSLDGVAFAPAESRTAHVPVGRDRHSLSALNARGQIAVSGTDRGTGQRGALLLTPAP